MKLGTASTMLASSILVENVSCRSLPRSQGMLMADSEGQDRSTPRTILQRRRQLEKRPTGKLTNKPTRECAPKTTQYTRNYTSMHDAGLLDCEPSKYCQKDNLSSLGGFCVPDTDTRARGLQDYYTDTFIGTEACDPNVESYYECDCSDFDPETETGSFSCMIYENYCFQDQVCGNFFVRSEVTETESISSYCYSFVKPFAAEFCYQIRQDGSCEIDINGKACTSCAIVDVENAEIGYASFNCFEFGCTNTLAQLAGNDCLGVFLLDGVFPLGSESTLPPAFAPANKTLPTTSMPSLMPSIAPSVASQSPAVESSSPSQSAPTSSTEPTVWIMSDAPSLLSTVSPSFSPTESPTTRTSTAFPTISPTFSPSGSPTVSPTVSPSGVPTLVASARPSTPPYPAPSIIPSSGPTTAPIDTDNDTKANKSPPPTLIPVSTPKPTPFPSLSLDLLRRDPSAENAGKSSGSKSTPSVVIYGMMLVRMVLWVLI